MNYTIRSSLYLLSLILDNIVLSDRVSVSSEVSQYDIKVIRLYDIKILNSLKFTDLHIYLS